MTCFSYFRYVDPFKIYSLSKSKAVKNSAAVLVKQFSWALPWWGLGRI